MTRVMLRPATADDLPHIKTLVAAAYAHYVERLGGPPRPMTENYSDIIATRRVTVAESSGEIIGLIVLDVDRQRILIDNVAVSPRHQGHGVGRALLQHAEAAARSAGFNRVYLYTHEKMSENLALYRRIGYVEYERRRHGRAHIVHMRKRLR